MVKRSYRRRHLIVRKKFQLRYAALIFSAILLSALVSGFTIYQNLWLLLGEKLSNVYPQGRLVEIFRSVNIRLTVNIVLVSVACIGISIVTSHKIAGPVYRIIRFLKDITETNNYTQRITLRKKDELKDLAEAINKLVDKLDKEKKA